MTPNQMQNNAAAIKKLYDEAEAVMLKKMADGLIGDSYDVLWYNRKMAEIDDMRKAISAELKRLEKDSKNMRDDYIKDAYNGAVKDFNRDNGQYLTKTSSTPEARMNAIVRLIQEQDTTFNAVNSAILRDTQDEYRSIIGKVVAMQATGVITTQEAIKKALNDFAERGIIGFTDKAGRRWEMGSYAEMAVRTGMMNARVEAYKDEMAAHGEHLVIISDHQDTCPLCADWERSILSVDGQELNDPECDGLLDDAVAAGLFHPNCQHSMTVYVKGLTDKSSGKSRQGYTKAQDEEGYNNRQIQRSLERKERMWKREMAVAQGYGDAERERFCYDKAMMYRDRIETLVNTTGLPRKKGREGGIVRLSDAAAKVSRTVQSELGQALSEVKAGGHVSDTTIDRIFTSKIKREDIIALDAGVSDKKAAEYLGAVQAWAGNEYRSIRRLQQGTLIDPEEIKAVAIHEKSIEKFIEKATKWSAGKTYRAIGLTDDELNSMIKKVDRAESISMLGTSSWTTDREYAHTHSIHGNNRVIFICDTQENGVSIMPYSLTPYEYEVLVSKAARYKPIKYQKENDITYIYLEE